MFMLSDTKKVQFGKFQATLAQNIGLSGYYKVVL